MRNLLLLFFISFLSLTSCHNSSSSISFSRADKEEFCSVVYLNGREVLVLKSTMDSMNLSPGQDITNSQMDSIIQYTIWELDSAIKEERAKK